MKYWQELIKEQVTMAKAIREGTFFCTLAPHRDQIEDLIHEMEGVRTEMHPDSDEEDTLSFWVGDVLEPLLWQLEKKGVEDFSPAELLKMKQQQEYAKAWIKELTTP
jgi:hypothetical protein